jgi:putative aminopeptidase FrvX
MKSTVKASSILEVVIAMVVIVTVFTVAMMIYGNVQRLSLSGQKIKVRGILQETLINAERNPENTKRSLTIDNISVDEEISNYNQAEDLKLIDLVAYDLNREKIAELREVVNANK